MRLRARVGIAGPAALAALLGATALLTAAARAADAQSYLGLHTRSNSNVLEQRNVIEGITVTDVVENSPAAAAGVQTGDVLLEANGASMAHPSQLENLVDALPPGSLIRLRLERDQAPLDLEARTTERLLARPPPEPGPTSRVERRFLGFEFAAAGRGVEIVRIAARSPLLAVGLRPGDVLWKIDGETIPGPAELLEFLESDAVPATLELCADRGETVLCLDVDVYRPERRLVKLSIPLLFSMERDADQRSYSALLWLFRLDLFEAGSRVRLLWFFSWETGTWDELLEVEGS